MSISHYSTHKKTNKVTPGEKVKSIGNRLYHHQHITQRTYLNLLSASCPSNSTPTKVFERAAGPAYSSY